MPLTEAQVESFGRDGFVAVPHLVDRSLLESLQHETAVLIDAAGRRAPLGTAHPDDFAYGHGPSSAAPVLRRIEYVVDKLPSCRRLLADRDVLGIVERLQGPDFIPTWDSMVVKVPGDGVEVAWHRDDRERMVGRGPPIFNVDVYLDDASEHTALWAIPGSHRWSDEQARQEVARRSEKGFDAAGATQVPMRAGDVLLHDIRLVHGSPPSTEGALRRVVYLEFRPVATELAVGPHTEPYIEAKRAVLAACAGQRDPEPGELRVPHEQFWRGWIAGHE